VHIVGCTIKEIQHVYTSTPAPPNNIRSDVLNHGTNTRTETEHGQNSYLQNINKLRKVHISRNSTLRIWHQIQTHNTRTLH